MAVMKHYDQGNLEKKGFIQLTLPGDSPSLRDVKAGTQTGQDVEARADAGAMEGRCLLASSSGFAQPFL